MFISSHHIGQHSLKSGKLEDEKDVTEKMQKKNANSLVLMQHTFGHRRIQMGKRTIRQNSGV